MLIPSDVNIPNCFTNVWFLKNTSSFKNLARGVRVLIFQRNKILTFLVIPVTGNFWSVNWWNFVKNQLVKSSIWRQYGNSKQYWLYQNFNKTRWHGVLIFLVLCFIRVLLIVFDDTNRERWGVTCLIKFLSNPHLFIAEVSRIHAQLYLSLREWNLVLSLRNAWKPIWC